MTKKGMQSVGDLFAKYKLQDKGGYITQEFQDFGYRLAVELDDLERIGMYMRMAKVESRGVLERALGFVKDAAKVKSNARLFMWKVKQIKDEKKSIKDTSKKIKQESLWDMSTKGNK